MISFRKYIEIPNLCRCGEGGGGREEAESESDAGRDGPQYSGTDTSYAQVDKLSCVDTRRQESNIRTGREHLSPPLAEIGGWADKGGAG